MARTMIVLLIFLVCLSNATGTIPQYDGTDSDNGGHSSEFKPSGYDWKMDDLEYVPHLLDKIYTLSKRRSFLPSKIEAKNKIEKVDFDAKFDNFYRALPKVLKNFEADLERVLIKYHLVGIVTGRLKNLSSLCEKMTKEKITDYRNITDIVGLRVTLQTLDDILRFKKAYLKVFNDLVGEIRCYGVCGPVVGTSDRREKIYWPWRGSGYRRLHLKVAIPHLHTAGEIQVGTPYMTLWADWEHDTVYKGSKQFQQNSQVEAYAQRLAKYYTMLDDLRNGMSPQCPQILRNANPKQMFGAEKWKVFGSPRDSCNFWNDLSTNMP